MKRILGRSYLIQLCEELEIVPEDVSRIIIEPDVLTVERTVAIVEDREEES